MVPMSDVVVWRVVVSGPQSGRWPRSCHMTDRVHARARASRPQAGDGPATKGPHHVHPVPQLSACGRRVQGTGAARRRTAHPVTVARSILRDGSVMDSGSPPSTSSSTRFGPTGARRVGESLGEHRKPGTACGRSARCSWARSMGGAGNDDGRPWRKPVPDHL